jgi:hypothetical protein
MALKSLEISPVIPYIVVREAAHCTRSQNGGYFIMSFKHTSLIVAGFGGLLAIVFPLTSVRSEESICAPNVKGSFEAQYLGCKMSGDAINTQRVEAEERQIRLEGQATNDFEQATMYANYCTVDGAFGERLPLKLNLDLIRHNLGEALFHRFEPGGDLAIYLQGSSTASMFVQSEGGCAGALWAFGPQGEVRVNWLGK